MQNLRLQRNDYRLTRSLKTWLLYCFAFVVFAMVAGLPWTLSSFAQAEESSQARYDNGFCENTGRQEGGTDIEYSDLNAQDLSKDWRLILVNPQNSIPTGYSVTLGTTSGGAFVDERILSDLEQMMSDCRSAGLAPLICSSYRSQEKQESLFDNQVQLFLRQGLPEAAARTEAAKNVAVPGTSEHQLGLAVDIVDANDQNLTPQQADTPTQQWLMQHCWEYGFILRYTEEKSSITQINYEPWHYRYVGREAAQAMYEQGLCLEEYLDTAG